MNALLSLPALNHQPSLWQRKAGAEYMLLREVILDEDESERSKLWRSTLKLIQAGFLEVEEAGKGRALNEGRWKDRIRRER